jgi:hypothetical protein
MIPWRQFPNARRFRAIEKVSLARAQNGRYQRFARLENRAHSMGD